MRFAGVLTWNMGLLLYLLIMLGIVITPWVPLALAIICFILFGLQVSIERVPAIGFFLGAVLFLGNAFSAWVYRMWQKQGMFVEPITVSKVMATIGILMSFALAFAYHRYYYTFKRERSNQEKEQLVQQKSYGDVWQTIIHRFKRNEQSENELYVILGNVVKTDD